MNLLDHFRPPLHPIRHWEAFHAMWAVAIGEHLNSHVLPSGYFAVSQVHAGSRVEVDVATFDFLKNGASYPGTAVAEKEPEIWVAPAPIQTRAPVFPDSIEVLVYADEGGSVLVAAIELISPGNKDREETKRAFLAKCSSYPQQGVGVAIIDIVTSRRANLHDDLVASLGHPSSAELSSELYASAYRPVQHPDSDVIDSWVSPLQLDSRLTTLPLALQRGPTASLDLDSSYTLACDRSYFHRTHQLPINEDMDS